MKCCGWTDQCCLTTGQRARSLISSGRRYPTFLFFRTLLGLAFAGLLLNIERPSSVSDLLVHECLHDRHRQIMLTVPRWRLTSARVVHTELAAHSGQEIFGTF
jgi:hypothetical protein